MRCMYGGKIRLHGEVSWQEMESLDFQKLRPAEEPYTSRLMFMPLRKAIFQIHGRALTLLGDLAAKAIQEMGVPNVIFWATAAVQAAHAMQFSRTFLSSLRDPLSSSLEVIMLVIGCAHQLHRIRISKNLFPEMCQPALYEPLHATTSTLVHHARYWSASRAKLLPNNAALATTGCSIDDLCCRLLRLQRSRCRPIVPPFFMLSCRYGQPCPTSYQRADQVCLMRTRFPLPTSRCAMPCLSRDVTAVHASRSSLSITERLGPTDTLGPM